MDENRDTTGAAEAQRGARPKRKHPWIRRLMILAVGLFAITAVGIGGANVYVVSTTNARIHRVSIDPEANADDAAALADFKAEAIVVLGAKVRVNDTPTPMLNDRLKTAAQAYKDGVAPKVLVTGADGRTGVRDEVSVMRRVLIEQGVPAEDIVVDPIGNNTAASAENTAALGYSRVAVVTQNYHLHRALFLMDRAGVDAVGIPADLQKYGGQWTREVREWLARTKGVAVN